MPDCRAKLVYDDIHEIRGVICHIEAASEGGPRYNPLQDEMQRDDYSNLIIFCPNCHADVDKNPDKYSPSYLRNIKKQHESRFLKNPYPVPDDIIRMWKVSVNQDEFSFNKIISLFEIYNKLNNDEVKKRFYDDRLNYSLANISLKTLKDEPGTKTQLDNIFGLVSNLPTDEFMDAFFTLKVNIPPEIFNDYILQYKDRLEHGVGNTIRVPLSDIYWVIHNMDKESLQKLIDSAGNYDTRVFEDLIANFDYNQLDESTKFEIEKDIWLRLDKEKGIETLVYKNLLSLDTKIFNSLQFDK
jgi:hypothetical protein